MKEAIIQYNDDPGADGGHMVISWQPLVRCEDCRFYGELNSMYCNRFDRHFIPKDWYCADAERKEE